MGKDLKLGFLGQYGNIEFLCLFDHLTGLIALIYRNAHAKGRIRYLHRRVDDTSVLEIPVLCTQYKETVA